VNTSYSYDSVSHLLSVLHQAGTNVLDGASYTYDPAGNRSSKTNYLNGTTSNYTYDPLYELTQVAQGGSMTESYRYDALGNRLSSLGVPSYQYNSSNQLTANSIGNYTYDANGNTLSKSDSSGATQYSWDFENRLTQAVVPGVGTTTFRYDPWGRRVQKSGPLGTTNYLYDAFRVIQEADGSGNVAAGYTQGPAIDEPFAESRTGTVSYYHADGLGSITSLTNSSGAIAATYTYDGFGKLAASTGSRPNPFQFTARESDSETGLDYYRARYFDPNVGRFVSEDPSGTSGGLNLYEYVLNNPINLYDPTGLRGTKPKKPECGPNAVYCICCQGGNITICNKAGGNYSGWVSDCMRQHEQQHVKDLTCGGKKPCEGQPDGPLQVPSDEKATLECAAYRAELQCLVPAPKTKEIDDRRAFIQKQIQNYCGGK
jgi:RHS repeat-associated protein